MSWRVRRGQRGAKEAAGVLAGITLTRAAGAEDAAAAVRRAVARAELERPVAQLGIAAVGEPGVAEAIAAALEAERRVRAGTVDTVAGRGFDAVVAVAPASLPAAAVVEQVRPLGDALLGVVLVSEAGDAEEAAAPPPDDGLEALAALERAAGPGEARPLPATPERGGDRLADDLERRLADLERREAAFRKISQVVARRGAGGEAEARAAELEEQVRVLQARVAELEAERSAQGAAPPSPSLPGAPTIGRLEHLVADALDRGRPEAEEWSFYLPLLRERADAAGRLPPELDALVESVFGEALRA